MKLLSNASAGTAGGIDPGGDWQGWWLWNPAHEPVRVRGVCGLQGLRSPTTHRGRLAGVYDSRREVANPGMVVVVVVPVEEGGAEPARILDVAEASWE